MRTLFVILMFLSISNVCVASSEVDVLCGEIPEVFKRLGCQPTRYIPDKVLPTDKHPILFYDLSNKNLQILKAQFERARDLEKTIDFKNTALSIYWNLAEQGYADANFRLWQIFWKGELGIKPDNYWKEVFRERPHDIRKMQEEKESLKRFLEKKHSLLEKSMSVTSINPDLLASVKPSSENDDDSYHTDSTGEISDRDSSENQRKQT